MPHSRLNEVYLDSNATTPVMPAALQAAYAAMEDTFGNPSSSHTTGLRARSLMENARELARSVLQAGDGRIVFTSGATEAIQTAIFSTLCDVRKHRNDQHSNNKQRLLLYGATEHKAVPQALQHWNEVLQTGNQILEIPVDQHGLLDLDFLQQHVADADMVCTMAVNNETGVIHDLDAIESVIRTASEDVLWLVDGVQALGKMPLELSRRTIDYASFSGHKIYAPKGIGLLYCRNGKPLTALMAGGGQESGSRGGTENLPGVAAIATVLQRLNESPTKTFSNPETLECYRKKIVSSLSAAFPEIVFNTPFEYSVPTTINFAVNHFDNKELLDLFDAAGVRVSSGSACGSGSASSYVLDAMGMPPWRSHGAIRMSFGPLDTQQQIDSACAKIAAVGHALSDSCLVIADHTGHDPITVLDGLVQLKKGSNCTWVYLHADTRTCLIIDPFEELADRVESLVRCQDSTVLAILDTHNHVDHDSCRSELVSVLSDRLTDAAKSSDLLGWPTDCSTVTLADGTSAECIEIFAGLILARLKLPGHTTESFAYLIGQRDEQRRLNREQVKFAFTGDTVLIGGVGRTDFASSSATDLYDSLLRLPKVIDSAATVICPTHDYNNGLATTLACECRNNPLVARLYDANSPMKREEFLQLKPVVDQRITDETNSELVCGFLSTEPCSKPAFAAIQELKSYLESHAESLIIDVRERHEFGFALDWSELGLNSPPHNIPLSQLANFLPELLNRQSSATTVLFLCRSGRRSQLAAEMAARLGIENVNHVRGGLALNSVSSMREAEFVI